MKTQRALGLRLPGKHHATKPADLEWVRRLGVSSRMAIAFELNVWPKHYSDNSDRTPVYTQIDYVTGVYTWNGLLHLHGTGETYVYDHL